MNFKELTEVLSKHRKLIIVGEINYDKQEIICSALKVLGLEDGSLPITLEIDSPGGRSDAGLDIADAIRFCPAPVYGVVVSAMSAAFVVLQACDKRLAYPSAGFMFHGISVNGYRVDSHDFDERIAEAKRIHSDFLNDLSIRSGQPLSLLTQWSHEERKFSSKEALDHGFIDEILVPPKKK